MKGAQAAKERPILFSRPMVAALGRGVKTQTRRIMSPQPGFPIRILSDPTCQGRCPYGAVGDRLWVREPWRVVLDDGGAFVRYSDGEELGFPDHDDDLLAMLAQRNGTRNRHARYMPRWASRFLLEIVGIRVERVRAISEEDARAEGVMVHTMPAPPVLYSAAIQYPGGVEIKVGKTFRESFQLLWESIHGPGAWERNEWVWVVEFRRVDVTGGEP